MTSTPAVPAAVPSVAVGVCTYQRQQSLERTLDAIAPAASALRLPLTLIVVDNDGTDAAVERMVQAFAARSGLCVHYRIEPAPGISAARNAVFDLAVQLGVRFLAMLDDDEWPSADWLQELLRVQATSGAAVIGGPVRPVFPASADRLQRFARFWSVQRQYLRGRPFVFCSCNFLIDLQAIAAEPRPLFDADFGLSGGGDTVFFRRLFAAGHPMDWAEQACVFEEVPAARASIAWMRQRRYRVGNHAVRWESVGAAPWRALMKTLGLSVRLMFYPCYRREPEAAGLGWLLELDKVRGRWASHFGRTFVEYGRPLNAEQGLRVAMNTLANTVQALETRFRLLTFATTMVPTSAALALQFVTFAITARGLGAVQFGIYSGLLAVAGVGIEVVGVGGADLLTRSVARDRTTFGRYYGNLLLLLVLTLPLVVIGSVSVVSVGMHSPLPIWQLFVGLTGEILIGRMSASLESVMVAHRQVPRAGLVRMSTVLVRLIVAAGYFLAVTQHGLNGWILLVCAQSLLLSGVYALIGARYGKPVFELLRGELSAGGSFCLAQSSRAMQSNVDRMVLSRFDSSASLGIYAAASRVLQLGLFPIQIVTRTVYANFFVHGAGGLAASRRYALRVAPAMLAVGVFAALSVAVAALVAAPILGHDFAGAPAVTARLACALPLIALQYPAADALTGAGLQGLRARISGIGALGSGFLLLAGIKLGGVSGLIAAFLLAQLLTAVVLWTCVFAIKPSSATASPEAA